MADPGTIIVAYGYSGDESKSKKAKPPVFDSGADRNRNFEIAAVTLSTILKKWFGIGGTTVMVLKTWSKDRLFEALDQAKAPIRQVHIMGHGDASGMSLAYRYDKKKRLRDRALRFNRMTGKKPLELAKLQWKAEDALEVGYFEHGMDSGVRAALKEKHAKDACWQLWGCFAGDETTELGTTGDPVFDAYFRRFALGKAEVPGIAVEIATQLGVTCTAARDGNGLEFWMRKENSRKVRPTGTNERPVPPFWLWSTPGSEWVSFDPEGKEQKKVTMFQWTWEAKSMTTGEPPKWFIDAYGK